MTDWEKYWLWLCSVEEIGPATIDKLINVFGNVEHIFKAGQKALEKLPWLDAKQKAGLLKYQSEDGLSYLSENIKRKGISFVSCKNEAYPAVLKHIFEYPKGLFYIGTPPWMRVKETEAGRALAIVGARACTSLGRLEAERFAFELSGCGIHIISGMAAGIDAAAHTGALKAGALTTAVLGSGVDVCYPVKNSRLYGQLCEHGCIVSEYPPGSPPLAWHFPRRNRIISGLCSGVLVVEARIRSGSLITAGFALEQGKDIFAVPGRGCDVLSGGCNNLIRQGAFLADSPQDILDYYHIAYTKIKKNKIRLAKSENMVYSTMCLTPKYIEEICAQTALPAGDVMSALYRLEKAGLIIRLSAQQYMVKQTHAEIVIESDDGA